MDEDLGVRFAGALADKDASALKALFRPGVDFKALTPGRSWEASDPEAVVDDIVLGMWFDPDDRITELIAVDTDTVGSRHRVAYRVAVSNADGDHVVEQQAYFDVDQGQISWMRVLCSGYQPVGTRSEPR